MSQKALYLDAKLGGKYYIGSADIPKPGSGEILVKIHSTALNPVDWKIRDYGVFMETYPAILGTDIAGEVIEVGEGVTNVAKGDRVFGQGAFKNDRGSFQQYAIQEAPKVSKIPSSISYDEASSIAVGLTVGYVGLFNKHPHGVGITPPFDPSTRAQYSNTPIVILGGSSSVGQYVIQMAKLAGFSPIITTSSLKHSEFLKSLGANHVLDRSLTTPQLVSEIAGVTSKPIQYIYDTISAAETQKTGVDILAPGGNLILTLPTDQSVADVKDKTIVNAVGIHNLPQHREVLPEMYKHLYEWLEQGALRPNKVEILPGGLAGIEEGLERLKLNKVSGFKLVARPQETA